MTLLYERRADESSKAFEAFVVYSDLGVNRSLDLVSQKLSKSRALIQRWSSQYNWVERAAAWDDMIEAQARKKVERDAVNRRAEMLKRHALSGKVLQQKGVEYLSKKEGGIDRGSDAIQAVKIGIAIERAAENLPEYLMTVVEAPDDELVRAYNDLIAQITGVGSGDGEAGNTDTGSDTARPTAE